MCYWSISLSCNYCAFLLILAIRHIKYFLKNQTKQTKKQRKPIRVISLIFIVYSETFGIYVVHFIYLHLRFKQLFKANHRMIQTNNITDAKKNRHKKSGKHKVQHSSSKP